ncbi:cell envelope integrity EipB family protein [Methylocystis heyeri]|uniref:DUF1849 family protein n=1 Tax=Methylocystis heyeri TaxID=391905 RepID=A0A6B8KL10_9HYPH|nr:cell envelope integrity EipB family protein [Methylocystis heyeri]QGM47625.1 DUF1849 family protein [Methylocystis heyeri]
MLRKGVICALLLGPAALLAGSAHSAGSDRAGSPPPLTAYRAVYNLSLARSGEGGTLASVRGRIAFDFSGTACDGYVENFQQVTELQPAEGPLRLSDLRSRTFEGGDGKDFRFEIESRLDNEPMEKLGGKANKSAGVALAIDLAKPAPRRAELPGEALFPAEHLRKILRAALAQEKIVEARVYDGSDDGFRLLDTTTIIGKPVIGAVAEKAAQIESLSKMRRWPVSISYFDVKGKDAPPLYVMSFDLYENGVSRALNLDYGDFSLAGEMTELSLLPTPAGCDR